MGNFKILNRQQLVSGKGRVKTGRDEIGLGPSQLVMIYINIISDTEDGQVMNPASSWVEELEEKPEINEFGQIAPRRSINQSNLHHHHQQHQQQQHQQQQGQNELGGNGSNGQGGSNMNGQGVNGGHNGGQMSHQNHIQNQFQSNHPSSSWYPYSYPTNQNRDSFSSSLITYSENNNVIGIS